MNKEEAAALGIPNGIMWWSHSVMPTEAMQDMAIFAARMRQSQERIAQAMHDAVAKAIGLPKATITFGDR